MDLESDKPKITLNNPTSDKIYKESLTLEGTIVDDDYVKGLFYSIDNGDEVFLKTFNTFYENIDGLQSGKHKITITPVDNNDIQGDTVTVITSYSIHYTKLYEDSLTISGLVYFKYDLDVIPPLKEYFISDKPILSLI